jgi:uncharacterized protein
MCVYSETCGKALAVEHDGALYSCDHFVYPEFRLGSISEDNLSEMVLSRQQVKFGYAKSEALPGQCRTCDYLSDCWGECPKNRIVRSVDGEPGVSYLCTGLKRFYGYALPKVERIVADIGKRGPNPQPRM